VVAELRVLLLADTHLGYDAPVHPRVQRRRRGPDFLRNYRRVLDHARRARPDLVVHGGDFFFRSRVAQAIVDEAYEPLFELAESGVPVVIVPGNHDRSRLPPSLWLSHPAIRVFDRPRTFRLAGSDAAVAVAGFPFARGSIRDDFHRIVEETGWRATRAEFRLLCVHQAFEGATVGPSDYTFRSSEDVIRTEDIPSAFTAVLAGHIHRHQVLGGQAGADAPPVYYPGSVERTSFAERDEPKGFVALTLRAPARGGRTEHEFEFFELPARPMIDICIDPTTAAPDMPAHVLGALDGVPRDAVVRLRCARSVQPPQGSMLSAAFLRSVVPSSMNIQLGPEFMPERRWRRSRA
jgi:DNA repair exonuclease SbcCD nuclease subunit